LDMAVAADILYAIIAVTVGLLLSRAHAMSAVAAILLTGAAAALASVPLFLLLPNRRGGRNLPPPGMLRAHFGYGKWAAGSEAVNWLINNGPLIVLPFWYGLAASGQFRVITLLYMPLQQTVSAMTSIILRRFTAQTNGPVTAHNAYAVAAALGSSAFAYSILAVAAGHSLLAVIFGPEFKIDFWWLAFAGLYTTIFVSAQGLFVAMRAREEPRRIFVIHVTVLAIGGLLLPFCAAQGIGSVLLAQSLAWAIAFVFAAFWIRGVSSPTTAPKFSSAEAHKTG
jgi:O-antigen/teichoic acid export membrane protein